MRDKKTGKIINKNINVSIKIDGKHCDLECDFNFRHSNYCQLFLTHKIPESAFKKTDQKKISGLFWGRLRCKDCINTFGNESKNVNQSS